MLGEHNKHTHTHTSAKDIDIVLMQSKGLATLLAKTNDMHALMPTNRLQVMCKYHEIALFGIPEKHPSCVSRLGYWTRNSLNAVKSLQRAKYVVNRT